MNLVKRVTETIFSDTSVQGTKYAALDGLRGLAVLTVFLSHSSGFRQRLTPWTSFHGAGHIGVYLFFVLSGFLLALSLLGGKRLGYREFMIRRGLRIAPLFFLIVSTVFFLQISLGGFDLFNLHVKDGWDGFLRHLIFYQGDSVFWTIAAEFEFYLILPLLVTMLLWGGFRAAWFFAAVAVFYFIWYAAIESGAATQLPPLKVARIVHNSQFLDVFLCGVLAAWVWKQPGFSSWWSKHQRVLEIVTALLLALGVLAGLFLTAENIFGFGRFWRNAQAFWIQWSFPEKFGPATMSLPYALVFVMVTLGAMQGSGLLQRLFEMRWLRWVGVTGFSWYLIHFPVLRFSNWLIGLPSNAGADVAWSLKEPLAWATSFIITGAAASVLYLAVERPFMMMSQNIINQRRHLNS